MISVRIVALTSPPMTTVASGFWTSAPGDVDITIGKKPSIGAAPVRTTERSRCFSPFKTRSVMSVIPSFSRRLNSAISTMPLRTATPNNAIKPTPALMEKCPDLQIIPTDKVLLSELTKIITENSTRYHECKVKVDEWIKWYQDQKAAFDGMKK